MMTMHEELVKKFRYCGNAVSCLHCPYWKGCGGSKENLVKAANAIEGLSAKATPKRVGFDGWKGCRNTRYKCPYCKKNVRNDETYCHKCGQALMFPHISFTPYVPGELQEAIVTWPDEPPKEETC